MNAAVFLDRDNTLIHNDGDLGDPEQVRLIQGAASAIASLRGLGYKVVVVSNQGGVARGRYDEAAVESVHRRIADLVRAASGAGIDKFYFCPFHPEGTVEQYRRDHPWRKPSPGMLFQAAKDLNLDLSQSWMIGDQVRDIQAGAAAGTRTVLLTADAADTYKTRVEQVAVGDESSREVTRSFTAKNLIEAVRIVAQQRKPEAEDTRKPDAVSKTSRVSGSAVGGGTLVASPPPVALDASDTRPARSNDTAKPLPATDAQPPARATGESTLREILQELRNPRHVGHEFTAITIIAIVLQMIAGVCLLGGLLMSGNDFDLLVRWMGTGIMFQLATVALLLYPRRGG